jgi:glutathionylspermidine synthase
MNFFDPFAPIRLEATRPRLDWKQRVEESGLLWHGQDSDSYWNEYEHLVFTLNAAEKLEAAANELHALCLNACEQIITRGWWDKLGIADDVAAKVQDSWIADDFSLYGRFDIAWDGTGQPKLLEYNADTPTSLLEAAVVQWDWLQDCHAESDQLNSLHEALVERWKLLPDPLVHLACVWDMVEDRQTIAYLAETAEQAGKVAHLMDMAEIGYLPEGRYTDPNEQVIDRLFKLYPWEWMVKEPFFAEIGAERARFIEPMWKMMLSNKALLPILWELNPRHPLLLPATRTREEMGRMGISQWVEKPVYGREGGGITVYEYGTATVTGRGAAESEAMIYQQRTNLFRAGGRHFVWGLWMVDENCCCLSARGDVSPVTGNMSRFHPHRIV